MTKGGQISSSSTPCWQMMHNKNHGVILLFESNLTFFLSAAGCGFIRSSVSENLGPVGIISVSIQFSFPHSC